MDENTRPVTLAGQPKAHVRRAFRADLRAKGVTGVDAMALAFREKWAYGWLRSYRLARGLTAAEAAYQFNALFGLVPGDKGYYHVSVIGKNETFPDHNTSRRPPVSSLIGLAMVCGTHPTKILDPNLRQYYSYVDLYFLETYRPALVPPPRQT